MSEGLRSHGVYLVDSPGREVLVALVLLEVIKVQGVQCEDQLLARELLVASVGNTDEREDRDLHHFVIMPADCGEH
jgi:hypothetical protein